MTLWQVIRSAVLQLIDHRSSRPPVGTTDRRERSADEREWLADELAAQRGQEAAIREVEAVFDTAEPDDALGATPPGILPRRKWAAYFSPGGGCTAAVVAAISRARSEILVQAYSFTSPMVAAALVAAGKRGLTVRVVIDAGQRGSKWEMGDECRADGLEVVYDGRHKIAHNKVIVIDRRVVLTGSFNFSAAAEKGNAENLLVVADAALAAAYAANWELHHGHSSP